MNDDQSSLVHQCVLAACGCGHDGRLGLGDPLHPQGILSTSNLTLLPFFLQIQSSTTVEVSDKVRSVHCGGYHTIAWTQKGILYGWGVNEDGQLGIWSQDDGPHRKKFFAMPTRIAFFDNLYQSFMVERANGTNSHQGLCSTSSPFEFSEESVEEGRAGFILDVSCGAHHTMVLTRCGLYVCGKNTFGQLGLGKEKDAVFEWTPCDSLFGSGRHLFNRVVMLRSETVSSKEDICEWFDDLNGYGPLGEPGGSSAFLLQGELTHISCGTHHSLLAFRNALMVDNRDASHESKKRSIRWYPMLVLATGKGDFGELGYNGDTFSVLLAREKRQAGSLLQDVKHSAMQGRVYSTDQENGRCATGGTTASSTLYHHSSSAQAISGSYSTSLVEEISSAPSTGTDLFSNGWWKKQRRKERRPEFYSLHFLPVRYEPVNHWVKIPQELLPHTARREAYFTFEKISKMMKVLNVEPVNEKGSGSLSFPELEKFMQWKITSLKAMHLHSSLTLESHSTDGKTDTVSREQQVWHWGCYYCNEVEGLESSIPIREVWDQEGESIVGSVCVSNTFSLHAANEVVYRYRLPLGAASAQGVLLSKGSGALVGVGDEDAFEAHWKNISDPQWGGITQMHGRDHVLFVVEKENSADHVIDSRSSKLPCFAMGSRSIEVWGMGSNLHGQLGHENTDLFASPIPVVRSGDEVVVPYSATVAHPAIEKGEDDENACVWKVAQIRSVAAGVNHSMFLMDIFKDNAKKERNENERKDAN